MATMHDRGNGFRIADQFGLEQNLGRIHICGGIMKIPSKGSRVFYYEAGEANESVESYPAMIVGTYSVPGLQRGEPFDHNDAVPANGVREAANIAYADLCVFTPDGLRAIRKVPCTSIEEASCWGFISKAEED